MSCAAAAGRLGGAVGAHHRAWFRAFRRWHRERAARARGARRAGFTRALGDAQAAAAACQCARRSRGARAALRGRGRVLVRASGTEPLIRVMAEAPTEEETAAACERLCAAVEAALGRR